jgi:predicted outer membrane repeat protein
MTTLTVTTLSDAAGHAGLSLRDALAVANSSASGDQIVFAAGLSGTLVLEQGQLTIASNVTISGDNTGDSVADITISANGSSRIFYVASGSSTLDALTLRDGVATSGGAVLIARGASLTVDHSTITSNQTIAGATGSSRGGGISNLGNLTVKNTTVEQNTAYEHGGGIYNGGTLTAINSTINDNSARDTGGGVLSDGGLFVATNITVSGNTAMIGGGIANEYILNAHNITVTLNSSGDYGSGVFNTGTFNVANSIILGNGPGGINAEVFGAINASGVNIVGAGFDTNASDGLINAPSVAAVFGNNGLVDNGGPVETIMLAANANPAVDAAFGGGIPATDARGHVRVGVADLGALERDNLPVPDPVPTPDPTPTPVPDPLPTPEPDPVPTPDPAPEPAPAPVVLNVIKGTAYGDTVVGTNEKDVIYTYYGNDIVYSSAGDDRIYGSVGDDRLYGQYGDDIIVGGKGNDALSGGSGSDRIAGQYGNDKITGGYGDDILSGGRGYDRFVFDNLTSIDTVTDFDVRYDRIYLNHSVFNGLATGQLGDSKLVVGWGAEHYYNHVIYNPATGDLSFDIDGNGSVEAVTFASLKPWLDLTASDIYVY